MDRRIISGPASVDSDRESQSSVDPKGMLVRRGHNRNSYTFAMLVSTFALTMNLTVFVMSLSVGTSIPEPGPAVKLG